MKSSPWRRTVETSSMPLSRSSAPFWSFQQKERWQREKMTAWNFPNSFWTPVLLPLIKPIRQHISLASLQSRGCNSSVTRLSIITCEEDCVNWQSNLRSKADRFRHCCVWLSDVIIELRLCIKHTDRSSYERAQCWTRRDCIGFMVFISARRHTWVIF